MLEHKFDEILDFLCSGILSEIEREEMRDELYDHLMTKYEINLAVGMDEEKATEEAVNALGNREVLKDTIAKVHKSTPAQTLKSALNCLALSFIFFAIAFLAFLNYFEISAVLMFCGLISGLFSLYSMRKIDVTDKHDWSFKNCFISFSIWFAVIIIFYSLSPIESLDKVLKKLEFVTVYPGINLFFLVIRLIKNLIKPYNKQLADAAGYYYISLGAVFAGTVLFCFFNFFGIFIDSSYFATELFLQVLWVVLAFFLFATSLWISRVSQSLYQVKHNYIIETSFKKKMILVTSFALISLVLIGSVDILYLSKTPEVKPCTVDDYNFETDADYERICDNLICYGVPETVVSNLPKSEISSYSSAADYFSLSDEAKNIIKTSNGNAPFSVNNLLTGELTLMPEIYAIPLHSTDKANYIRALIVFNVSIEDDDYFKTYRDGIFFNVLSDNMIISENSTESDDFLMILQKNFETYELEQVEPFNIIYLNYNGPEKINGFEFKPEDGMIVVCSKTLKFEDLYETEGELNIEYIHKQIPFTFFHRTPEDVFESENESASGYVKTNKVFGFCFAMPDKNYS